MKVRTREFSIVILQSFTLLQTTTSKNLAQDSQGKDITQEKGDGSDKEEKIQESLSIHESETEATMDADETHSTRSSCTNLD
jgi:hypothetical protein